MTAAGNDDFRARVAPFRGELQAYCYRMLGSVQDAEDAVQDALLGAWRGLAGFEGRSSLRSWLYQIATHACLRLMARRQRRIVPPEHGPPSEGTDLAPMLEASLWLEPYPADAGMSFEQRESIELAFVAALQHLPGTQRAALILRDVLGFEASEAAEIVGASVAALNSALQRARQTMQANGPATSQQAMLRDLGEAGERALVTAFVDAWGRSDVDALVKLLAEDARFSMPPIPTWFVGREAIGRFFRERVFATPWRLVPMRASAQPAFACYQGPDFRLGALNVIGLRGPLIAETTGFLDPAVHARFLFPDR